VTTTVGVIGAVSLATLVGCSSDQPTVAPPAAKTDLTNTSWSGPCSGTGLGAFTLQFGAGNTDGGMVKILFPDATTVKTVPYTLKSNDSGHTAFTIALEPPWKGTLQRDYQNLEMSYVVGDEPGGHHCSLVRQGTSGTS
jgi:hypothetical protein